MSPPEFRPQARTPRGFADRRAGEVKRQRAILDAVSKVYEAHGFEPLETSAFEYADALGKFLPDADRPNEGVFALQDGDAEEGAEWMALRYDLTAPLARFAAQNWETLPKPFRRYAFGTVWRNEKPGPGRYREFVQCDADTVGSARPEADAEIVAMAVAGFEAAGLPPGSVVLKINSRKIINGLLESNGVTDVRQQIAAVRAIDKHDRLGLEGVRALLGEGRRDESGAFTQGAQLNTQANTAIVEFLGRTVYEYGFKDGQLYQGVSINIPPVGLRLGVGSVNHIPQIQPSQVLTAHVADAISGSAEGEEGLKELDAILSILRALKIGEDRARFDPSIVRGLEYYTGAVFEADLLLDIVDDKGAPMRFGSVGGGGRYDDLVARFTGQTTPATGFSFGVSRLSAALAAAGHAQAAARGPVVVIAFNREKMADYFAVAAELRSAGIAAEVYLGESGMKAQMKYADRRMAPAVVILGDDEIAAATVTVKDLDLGRAAAQQLSDNAAWKAERPGQATIARGELASFVKRIVGG